MQVFKCTYVRMRRQGNFFEWLTRKLDQWGAYRVSYSTPMRALEFGRSGINFGNIPTFCWRGGWTGVRKQQQETLTLPAPPVLQDIVPV